MDELACIGIYKYKGVLRTRLKEGLEGYLQQHLLRKYERDCEREVYNERETRVASGGIHETRVKLRSEACPKEREKGGK